MGYLRFSVETPSGAFAVFIPDLYSTKKITSPKCAKILWCCPRRDFGFRLCPP